MSASTTRRTSCLDWATSATACSARGTRAAPSPGFLPHGVFDSAGIPEAGYFPTSGEELLAELRGVGGFVAATELLVRHAGLRHEVVLVAQGRVCHRSRVCADRAADA